MQNSGALTCSEGSISLFTLLMHLNTCIIHGDLKSSNILLDQDMTHVGDFGQSNMFPTPESSCGTNGIRGSYVPPAGDVYSFGILVLEILRGRSPTDEALKDNLNLHKFVSSALSNHIAEIVFTKMKVDECVASMVSIGVACSRKIPSGRMSMAEVIRPSAADSLLKLPAYGN